MPQKAIIIGAGIAGIATALRLRAKGYDTTIFEANAYPGGKLHRLDATGYTFDYGPSLFTMPHFVDELFKLFGRKSEDHFKYKRKETICNYLWEDGTKFAADSNIEDFIREASEVFKEPSENIRKYLVDSKKKYDITSHIFLEKSLHKVSTYLSKDTLKSALQLGKLDIGDSLDSVNKRFFQNPKLIQLFNRYATYNGSNPYKTPGIMSLIPQLEMDFGTYYPEGGMHAITTSLVQLANEVGVEFKFNEKVTEVVTQNGYVKGIRTESTLHTCDQVVCNMDVFSAYHTILKNEKKPKKVLKQERSSSAIIFHWGIKKQFPDLDLHNILFSDNYEKEFDYLFNKKSVYSDPTIYINISSKEDPDHAPKDSENWFVMVNAPSNEGQDWESLKTELRRNVLNKLKRMLNIDLSPLIETEIVVDPIRIENDTLSHQGSLYGTSSNSKFAAFLRHPNFSNNINGLYFCGGSAHPGGGIPLCLLSAKIVSDLTPDAE